MVNRVTPVTQLNRTVSRVRHPPPSCVAKKFFIGCKSISSLSDWYGALGPDDLTTVCRGNEFNKPLGQCLVLAKSDYAALTKKPTFPVARGFRRRIDDVVGNSLM